MSGVREEERPEWLPAGWTMKVNRRERGSIDRCYFNPFTGSKFYSKREVFRYLESGELHSPMPNKNRSVKTNPAGDICTSSSQTESIDNKFTDNVLVQIEHSPNGLPDGWIKEIKIRKANTKHGIRKDSYYIDPVSGYVFSSRKDAFHYIETGEVSKYAFRPRKRHTSNMYSIEEEGPPPIAAKRQISRGNAVRRSLFSGQAPKSNKKMVIEIDELPKKLDLPLNSHPSAQGVKGADSSSLPPSVEHLGNETENLHDPASCGEGIFPQSVREKPFDETPVYLSPGKDLDEKIPIYQVGNEELAVSLNNLSEEKRMELIHKKPLLPANAKSRRGRKKHGSEEQVESQKQASVVLLPPKRTKTFKTITLPLRSSKRLSGTEADPVANSGIIDQPCRTTPKKSEQLPVMAEQGSEQGRGKSDEPELTPMAGVEIFKKRGSEEQVDSQKQASVVLLPPKRAKAFKAITLPLRSSKRLSGTEADPVANSGIIDRPRRTTPKKSDQLPVMAARDSEQGSGKSDEPELAPMAGLEIFKKHGSEEHVDSQKQASVVPLRPKRTKVFKAITLPMRSSKRLAGIKADHVANSGIIDRPRRTVPKKSEQLPVMPAQGSDQGGVKSDEPEAAPTVDPEMFKKPGGEEPPAESPLTLLFGDSWPDPCIEFAFKTLTSDIPMLEDTASIQDYFQQFIQNPNPVNLSQPDLHVQHPDQERRASSTLENGLQSGREAKS